MRLRAGFTLIELMIAVVILGLLLTIAIPNYLGMKVRAKEAQVKGMAHSVQLVAEVYAISNDGQYSDAAADLQPLFPSGNLMENPFTQAVTEPQFSAAAAGPGQVGIVLLQVAGQTVGYSVSCWGESEMIMTLQQGN